jgi:hypothetical protein
MLLGRPHRSLEKGDTEEGFEPQHMLDEEKLQFGQEYSDFLEVLFQTVSISVSQRPNSEELRQRIIARKTAQRRIPVIGLKDVVNPNVDKIRSLITSSSIASIGAMGYKDYSIHLEEKGKAYADERRRLYKIRHEADRHKKGTAGYFADKILW